MIESIKAKKAMESGFSAVCAWCEHYHIQLGQSDGKTFNCGKECNGPGGDRPMAFPQYKGPMQSALASMCFICGGEAGAAVDIHGHGVLGVCEEHIGYLKDMLSRPGIKVNVKEEQVVTF